jgi:hypothetical protein
VEILGGEAEVAAVAMGDVVVAVVAVDVAVVVVIAPIPNQKMAKRNRLNPPSAKQNHSQKVYHKLRRQSLMVHRLKCKYSTYASIQISQQSFMKIVAVKILNHVIPHRL